MEDTLSDVQAIARANEDPEAFVLVFRRHFPAVHRYLQARLGTDLADDLASETFVRAFRGRARFRAPPAGGDARPWLFGIATNLIHQHRRAEARRLRALSRVAVPPPEPNHADATASRVTAHEASAALMAGLRRLSRGDREVLLLFAWADLSYAEVAAALEIPEGTVRSRLHRARRLLRKSLAAEHADVSSAVLGTGDDYV